MPTELAAAAGSRNGKVAATAECPVIATAESPAAASSKAMVESRCWLWSYGAG